MAMSNEQFQMFLQTITASKQRSFASCNITYSGEKDADAVEAFIAAASTFKNVEKLSDLDALQGLPLLLRDEAAVWWQGLKSRVEKWEEFCNKLRHTFAPRRPAFMIYHQITHEVQEADVTTEAFIAKKRALFASLPPPALSETQQIDLIFALIRLDIRNRMPRDTVPTIDKLLETARGIEETLHEYAAGSHASDIRTTGKKGKVRCSFCKNPGHTADVCRKKKRAEGTLPSIPKVVSEVETQAPSPHQPKFSCYGCGAPGVYRSNCPTCKKASAIKKEDLKFCAINVQVDSDSRPVVFVEIEGIKGTAYIDTCAKMSVASYSLYLELVKCGCKFQEHQVNLTLADGIKKNRGVLMCRVNVVLMGRKVQTTFIVLPGAKDNRTLLGVGFLKDAGMVINLPQYTWNFIDEPEEQYELYAEEFAIFESTVVNEIMQLPSPVTSLTMTDSEASPSINTIPPTPPPTPPRMEIPELPLTPEPPSTPKNLSDDKVTYKLASIDFGDSSSVSKKPRLFDGYSPSFTDFMLRDAQINVHREDIELSPQSANLFDANNWDIRIDTINVETQRTTVQRKQLNGLLPENKHVSMPSRCKRTLHYKSEASSYTKGAVLVKGERESEHPVEFASRLLTAAERNNKRRNAKDTTCLQLLDHRRDDFRSRGGDCSNNKQNARTLDPNARPAVPRLCVKWAWPPRQRRVLPSSSEARRPPPI
ncbi:uncharacterized protein LOC124637073 [Helicoverpa zea]|uniref:uncharacterized protein LOC124637073 n=1 Tax=Helicoverpa zea TaxID=7113 RepID=UPI001F5A2938|nr:uncharacterized protein LOC124637073 [Helicoverpa zea]